MANSRWKCTFCLAACGSRGGHCELARCSSFFIAISLEYTMTIRSICATACCNLVPHFECADIVRYILTSMHCIYNTDDSGRYGSLREVDQWRSRGFVLDLCTPYWLRSGPRNYSTFPYSYFILEFLLIYSTVSLSLSPKLFNWPYNLPVVLLVVRSFWILDPHLGIHSRVETALSLNTMSRS